MSNYLSSQQASFNYSVSAAKHQGQSEKKQKNVWNCRNQDFHLFEPLSSLLKIWNDLKIETCQIKVVHVLVLRFSHQKNISFPRPPCNTTSSVLRTYISVSSLMKIYSTPTNKEITWKIFKTRYHSFGHRMDFIIKLYKCFLFFSYNCASSKDF